MTDMDKDVRVIQVIETNLTLRGEGTRDNPVSVGTEWLPAPELCKP